MIEGVMSVYRQEQGRRWEEGRRVTDRWQELVGGETASRRPSSSSSSSSSSSVNRIRV